VLSRNRVSAVLEKAAQLLLTLGILIAMLLPYWPPGFFAAARFVFLDRLGPIETRLSK